MSAERSLNEVNALLADAAEEMRQKWGDLDAQAWDAWMGEKALQIDALSQERQAAQPAPMHSQSIEDLGRRLGWTDDMLAHARDSLAAQSDYDDECVMAAHSGRELRTPAFPQPVDYLRITQHGFELAYWSIEEVKEDASDVLGALMGALVAGSDPAKQQDLTVFVDRTRDLDRQRGLL